MAPDLPLQQPPVIPALGASSYSLTPKEQHVLRRRRAPNRSQGHPLMAFPAPALWLWRAGGPGECLGSARASSDLAQIKDTKSDDVQTHIIPLPGDAKPPEGNKPSTVIPQVKSLLALGLWCLFCWGWNDAHTGQAPLHPCSSLSCFGQEQN